MNHCHCRGVGSILNHQSLPVVERLIICQGVEIFMVHDIHHTRPASMSDWAFEHAARTTV